jgi:hypothetical protein
VYDDTIYNFCARARFAGCSYLRHIILGLNTVWASLRYRILPVSDDSFKIDYMFLMQNQLRN